ncbi:mitochondrial ribosomal protein S28 [Nomia melanderi]|uniref:mitochondrial ribosomal protein S28 n=1 Tax=Nomia melanderi TaxID=2448451 RepID=UPI0013040229|nr:28S ribosomal protein S28, mitochondrial [Nomia melanderi]
MYTTCRIMDKIQCYRKIIRQLHFIQKLRASSILVRNCSTSKNSNDELTSMKEQDTDITKPKLSGFAASYEKFAALSEDNALKNVKSRSFTSLIRRSKFIDLGDPQGKVVVGKIFNVVGDDLYIDFGWKFHCVCPKPKKNSSKYVRGSMVNLRIKDLELSTRFLGSTTDLTILEADCILLNLISSPVQDLYKEE